MSCQPNLRDDPQQTQPRLPGKSNRACRTARPRSADAEMARVLKTAPLRMASDPSSGAIAHWKHGALHDVVEPMADHVIMTYPTGVQRLERRTGKSVAIGTARPRRRDDHSGRLELPLGYSRTCQRRSALPSAQRRSSALPVKPIRQRRAVCWSEPDIPTPSRPACS